MQTSLIERNAHERDSRIYFDEKPHLYYISGQKVGASVTGLVHQFFEKFDPETVIDKMMKSPWWYKSKYYGKCKEEIKEEWKQKGEEACTHGTYMHKTIEEYYNGWALSHPDTPEFNMFLAFAEDHRSLVEAYRTEWEVYYEEFDLAGSIDMVFRNIDDGTYSIYDWKRTKEIKFSNKFSKGVGIMKQYDDCNYMHYSLQLNIYKYILETKYDMKIRDMFLVCIHHDYDKYKKIEVADLTDVVNTIFAFRPDMPKSPHMV